MSDSELAIRTEDFRADEVLKYFVRTKRDDELVAALKSSRPIIIEGSRGTGKSFLLRVCEQEQLADFEEMRILPVYVSFAKSSLITSGNEQQFQRWMLARLCSSILRCLYLRGLLVQQTAAVATLSGGPITIGDRPSLEVIATQFEESYRTPGIVINAEAVPTVERFREAIEDICTALSLRRINVLFDEAAHIFRPEQQRQFFTLFRDLRSPYMTCNAAVYPGVTSYGESFEPAHDAQIESLNRDVTSGSYLAEMREIVLRQADSQLQQDIQMQGENFDALVIAVSGNPRLLLKTVLLSKRLRSTDVKTILKEFYRTAIWAEHSALTERYPGHAALIDWGRTFIEQTVIPDANRKNESRRDDARGQRTCYFWIHKEAPRAVVEALRLLMYTGIVTRIDTFAAATRSEVGTRYALNLGCLAAPIAEPIPFLHDVGKRLSTKMFSEYGRNYPSFEALADEVGAMVDADLSAVLAALLDRPVSDLDLTFHQQSALASIGVTNLREALSSTEADFRRASYIGPVRSRRMKNVATAAVLEFLSG